jgi:hypothetical protein
VGPLPAHLREIGVLPLVEIGAVDLGLVEQVAGSGVGEHAVAGDVESRHLLGPRRSAAGRHHGRHVPMQHAHGVAQGIEAWGGFEFAIGFHGMGLA